MRCPICKGEMQKLFEVECGNTMTLPVEQIMHVNPKSHLHQYIERLEPKAEKPKKPKIKAVEPIVKQFKPPKLLTLQKAKIKLYYCLDCKIFVKAVE